MTVQELEVQALKLSASEREELVRRLLTSVDPLLRLGTDPVLCGVADGSAHHATTCTTPQVDPLGFGPRTA
jgi:hypothetical protein